MTGDTIPACLSPRPSAATLVVRVDPLPGEGLPDLVQRAAAANRYTKTVDVLQLVDPNWFVPQCVGTTASGREAALAQVLGTSDGAVSIAPLVYARIPEKPGWHLFFGTPLRDRHRETTRRRVSPRGLRRSLHGRAIWTIKAFSFDPETGERLLDVCPECNRLFSYNKSLGLEFCDRCSTVDRWGFPCGKVDLRDHPQEVVEVDDGEALRFTTSLLTPGYDPSHMLRAGSPFSSTQPGELFEAVFSIACAVLSGSGGRASEWRPRSRADFAMITPEALAKAGRAILNWPLAFQDLIGEARASQHNRPGAFSLSKELGAFAKICGDTNIHRDILKTINVAVQGVLASTAGQEGIVRRKQSRYREDLMTLQEAGRAFGIDRQLLASMASDSRAGAIRLLDSQRAPVLIRQDLVERLSQELPDLVREGEIARSWGITRNDVRVLASRGRLRIEDGLAGYLAGKATFYRGTSIRQLETDVRARVQVDATAMNLEQLGSVVQGFTLFTGSAWADLIEAIVLGRLAVWASREPKSMRFPEFYVSSSAEARGVLSEWFASDGRCLKQGQVARALQTCVVSVIDLIRIGMLDPGLSQSHVAQFLSKFVFTNEVRGMAEAHRLQLTARGAPRFLRARGIRPVATLPTKGRLVWSRSEVEVVLSCLPG